MYLQTYPKEVLNHPEGGCEPAVGTSDTCFIHLSQYLYPRSEIPPDRFSTTRHHLQKHRQGGSERPTDRFLTTSQALPNHPALRVEVVVASSYPNFLPTNFKYSFPLHLLCSSLFRTFVCLKKRRIIEKKLNIASIAKQTAEEEPALKHLLGLTLEELQQVALECGMPKFTGKQIADWVYKKKVRSIDEMTNISVSNRVKLAEKYDVGRTAPIDLQRSTDGTVKYLFRINEKQTVEAVMIPEDDRSTLCVSSQIGCKFNCLFCMTGKQGFNGHLSVTDIINQVYSVEESDQLTNLVFMGMGEPLDNYDRVKKVIELLTADYALGWSPKRITLSTTGVTPKLKLFLEETSAHLAVSLHNPFPSERLKIMPAEKAFPIVEVINLLKQYDWSKQRRLSFEYIMFEKLNDSIPFARELVRLLNGLDCRVNLIRFHAIPGVSLKTSDNETMVKFRDYMTNKGVTTTIRSSRGEDIFAACGMLANVKQNEEQERETTSEEVKT